MILYEFQQEIEELRDDMGLQRILRNKNRVCCSQNDVRLDARFSTSKPIIRAIAFTQEPEYDHMQDTRFHLNITN